MELLAEKITRFVGSPTSIVAHTLIFIGAFALVLFGFDRDTVLLVLTTIVSLEAIYLSIFIQMTVNRNTESLATVEKDVDEIQEDIGEIQEDVDEIQKDVDEIQEDVDEIQEEVGEIHEDEEADTSQDEKTNKTLEAIQNELRNLIAEVDKLRLR